MIWYNCDYLSSLTHLSNTLIGNNTTDDRIKWMSRWNLLYIDKISAKYQCNGHQCLQVIRLDDDLVPKSTKPFFKPMMNINASLGGTELKPERLDA